MGLYEFIKKSIFNDKRIKEEELDLNNKENNDILENPKLLSHIIKKSKNLTTIKVNPNLSEEIRDVLEKEAPNKDYTYKSDKQREYWIGYEDVNKIENVNVDFNQYKVADEIYEKIINGLNSDWSDLAKFKYIYNELAMSISYDYSVLPNANDDIENMIKADNNAGNIFTSILTKKGVCRGIVEAYQYLCNKANLTCEIENNFSMKHAYNIITYKNEKGKEQSSYCDLTWDLQYVKRGQPCKYFANSSKDFIKKHPQIEHKDFKGIYEFEQCDIDAEIGYVSEEYEYKIYDYMDMLESYKETPNDENKVNTVLQKMMELGELKHMSHREVVYFALALLDFVGIKDADVSITFVRNQKEDIKDTRGILWVKDKKTNIKDEDKYLYYIFNENQQQFNSLDKEILEDLLLSGMLEFYADTKLPGFEYWGSEKQIQRKMRDCGVDR